MQSGFVTFGEKLQKLQSVQHMILLKKLNVQNQIRACTFIWYPRVNFFF